MRIRLAKAAAGAAMAATAVVAIGSHTPLLPSAAAPRPANTIWEGSRLLPNVSPAHVASS